ncbi:hypothetical protein C1N84_07150 [Pantoea sp. SGAir0418]
MRFAALTPALSHGERENDGAFICIERENDSAFICMEKENGREIICLRLMLPFVKVTKPAK